ncbi:MAG: aldo/keto reductase [Candidatus Hydrogenedentota bacterium]
MQTVTVQGVNVPALGFGTWRLSGTECREAVSDALALGYRHIDTARMYRNETEAGQGIRDAQIPREDVFLVTKLWLDDYPRRKAERAIEDSLRQLNAEYIDLLLMHWPPSDTPLEETLDVMSGYRDKGDVLHLGVSNFSPDLTEQALKAAPILTNQIEYHPFKNQIETVGFCQTRDIMITAYSPVARGAVMKDPVIGSIAERHGKTPAQVTLRWLIQQDKVSAIPKAASPEHRRSNFDIWDFELPPDDMRAITALGE